MLIGAERAPVTVDGSGRGLTQPVQIPRDTRRSGLAKLDRRIIVPLKSYQISKGAINGFKKAIGVKRNQYPVPPRLVDGIHLEARLYDQAQCIPVIIGATVLHGWDTRERAIVRGWSAGPSSASAGIIKIEFMAARAREFLSPAWS